MRIFLDCDGVLADFDKRAIEILGVKPRDFEGTEGEDSLWERLYATNEFFYSLDPMPDMEKLVRGVEALGYFPTVLTGIPKPKEHQLSSVPAADQKRKWVAKHLGKNYPVITCRSAHKCNYLQNAGDVLVDDWVKYKHLWEQKGGKFIVHNFADESLDELKSYLDDYQGEISRNAYFWETVHETLDLLKN